MQGSDDVLDALFGERIDRRRFLKRSAGGIALLGFGSLLPAGCTRYPKPPTHLRFLDPREYAIINTLAERLLDAAGAIGAENGQIDVGVSVDAVVADWDTDAQGQLRTMLRVFEHGTYLFDLRRKRFTRLTAAEQDQYLAGWMNSTLGVRRVVFRALKLLVAAGFYREPRAWTPIGYDGPWLGRIDAAARLSAEPTVPLSSLPMGRT
ncbi:MAG TPA: gluconate 2-dehydrogenase subunit 3 family protein [Candidatus Margulisiibacteriota bacterium]|nr:gluconate 2-dehydrogenase subunit 3 family protein [Candidatus Margulisiibacteriota bacterium]